MPPMQREARTRGEEPEMLDRPGLTFEESAGSLLELDRVNRFLLGALPLQRTILPRLGRWSAPRRALDLGTGTGRVAHTLAQAAARQGAPLSIVGMDLKLKHLVVGRSLGIPQLRVVADARALPFRDGAVEWAFSTLFFHHFEAEDNRAVLAEMRRVSKGGAAVVDLRKSRLARWLLRLILPLLGAGPITRHDGMVSMDRAWRIADVRKVMAGERGVEVRRRFPFRFALVVPGLVR